MNKMINELDQTTDLPIDKQEQIRVLRQLNKDLTELLVAVKDWENEVTQKNASH